MSEEKAKAREFWIYEAPGSLVNDNILRITRSAPTKEITWPEVHVIEYSALEASEQKIKELEAKLWVAKDNSLRTYDGLAEKADKYDEAKEMLEKMATAINKAIYNDDYGSEVDEIPMDTLRNIRREYEEWKIKNRNGG